VKATAKLKLVRAFIAASANVHFHNDKVARIYGARFVLVAE
jgi:hypothetical protein